MQVEIQNFRCWKRHSVAFKDKGIILLNGTSGSGKSSILNSIFFAITGIGNKIQSYGEKKCSVKLTFEKGFIKEITRTKGPGRLTVKIKSKHYDDIHEDNNDDINNNNEDNYETLEDEEGQKLIDSVYGTNFQQTSYMTQKMVHSFLGFSVTEKMNFLQKIILDDTTSNIQEVKKRCKEKLSDFKKQLIEHKSKLNLYEDELNIQEKKIISHINQNKYENFKEKFQHFIEDYFRNIKHIDYDPNKLKKLRIEQSEILNLYNKFTNYETKEKDYLKNKDEILKEIDEYNKEILNIEDKLQLNLYKGDEYYEFLKNLKLKFKNEKELNTLKDKLSNEENNLDIFIKEQIEFLENEKEKIKSKHNVNNDKLSYIHTDINFIINNLDKWKKSFQTIIEFLNFKKENKKYEKLNEDIIESEFNIYKDKLDTLNISIKDKQKEINDLKQEWKLKNQIHKCPKCNISLRFENQNLKVDSNDPIDPILYKNKLNTLQDEEIKLNKEISDTQKKLYENECLKNEMLNYDNKLKNYTKRINNADTIFLKYIDFNLNNYEKSTQLELQSKLNEIIKLIDNDTLYKKEINDLIDKINEFSQIHSDIKSHKNSNINNITINQKIKSINKLKKDIKDIENLNKTNLNLLKFPEVPEQELDELLLKQTVLKEEFLNNKDKLEKVKSKNLKLNLKLKELNNLINSIQEFIKENIDINDRYINIENEINKSYKLEEEYNKYINLKKIYEEWKRLSNEKRIQKYLFDTVSSEIVVHEMFLNKINESESISLTNCIDTINYYINDYLEKFFPNDSIIVDIVPFKEKGKNDKSDKNDVKPGIDIKICYKGEEVELSSLSGGEHDRVSLAIMLAFNNICKSSMILLDESISSLDSDLTNDILEKLKENLSDKRIIMVAHQISTGLFDQVVNTSK